VIDENDSQNAKHCDPTISTFLRIKIDSSDEDKNPADSICVRREFGSKKIDSNGPLLSLT
jgi:hypothetical protein